MLQAMHEFSQPNKQVVLQQPKKERLVQQDKNNTN